MLKRLLSVLLLFCLCFAPVFSQDITIPVEEFQSIRGKLILLRENLKLREIEVESLLLVSEKQSRQLSDLMQNSENLETLITSLLSQSEISEKEYQEMLDYWIVFSNGLTDTINQLEKQNRLLKIALPVVAVVSLLGGVYIGIKIAD